MKAELQGGTGKSHGEFGFPVWGTKHFNSLSLPNVCG